MAASLVAVTESRKRVEESRQTIADLSLNRVAESLATLAMSLNRDAVSRVEAASRRNRDAVSLVEAARSLKRLAVLRQTVADWRRNLGEESRQTAAETRRNLEEESRHAWPTVWIRNRKAVSLVDAASKR